MHEESEEERKNAIENKYCSLHLNQSIRRRNIEKKLFLSNRKTNDKNWLRKK